MNLSLSAVARQIGLSKNAYANIETGRRNPSWEVAQRLERFFGIPAGELLAESDAEEERPGSD